MGRKSAKIIQHLTIAQSKALKNTTNNLSPSLRNGLAAIRAIVLYSLLHINRIGKQSIIRIYQTTKRFTYIRFGYQLRIRSFTPCSPATFQQPHPTNIFQQTDCTVHTSFISEIQSLSLICNNRAFRLHTHQRPGSTAQICKIRIHSRNWSYGRSSVMTGYCNHRYITKSGYALYFFCQCSYLLTGVNKAAEISIGKPKLAQ